MSENVAQAHDEQVAAAAAAAEELQNATQAEAPAEGGDSKELTISDLAGMRTLIDVASARGAFRPNEMVSVGTLYDKLNGFLEEIQKQAEAAKAKQEAEQQG
jgi:flagellar hook-associated protein FlgK